jgi:hypothetical protein
MWGSDLRIVDGGHSFEKTGLYSLRSRIYMWAARGLCWFVSLSMEAGVHRSDLALCLVSALDDRQLAVSKYDSVSSFPQDMDLSYTPV